VESDRQAPFRLRHGFLVPPWPTFPRAPLSSRTVGFPESGWRRRLSPKDLPVLPEVQALARIRPVDARLYLRLGILGGITPSIRGSARSMPIQVTRHLPRAPLPGERCYLRQGDVSHRLGQHYPAFVAHIGSCAAPNSSCRFRIPLRRQVFAGCCEPLLQDGASRRYLHNPRVGAWTRTPPLPPGASTRFFPGGIGLTQVPTRSARGSIPAMQLQQGIRFRGCSHSFMFRLPHSLGPPIAPTAEACHPRAAGPFTPRNGRTVTRSNCGIATYMNRAICTAGLPPAGLWPCRPLHGTSGL